MGLRDRIMEKVNSEGKAFRKELEKHMNKLQDNQIELSKNQIELNNKIDELIKEVKKCGK